MLNKFDIYTNHYVLHRLKSMRTVLALLHLWSATPEEFDLTIDHRFVKVQTHVDGLSWLLIEKVTPPPTTERKPL